MKSKPVNLAEQLARFEERYTPHTVAEFNGHQVMLAKLEGEFVWHSHDDTDDFFLVLQGELEIRLRENDEVRSVTVQEGELFIVPQGVPHLPVARGLVHCLLLEREGTPNTGDPATATPRVDL